MSAFCWHRLFLLLISCCCALATQRLEAQAGPPFRTDDPETPGPKHWEINVGFFGGRNPQSGSYSAPDLDMNYGVGERLQLKYELPLAVAESRPQSATATTSAEPGLVVAGLGNSLLGVKYRFYERHVKAGDAKRGTSPDPTIKFGMSTYPQLTLSNPTRSVARGVVSAGPDLLLPLEVNGRIGPIRVDGEIGYHFGNRSLAQSWIRGLLIGYEFTDRLEVYAELYDQQDANRINSTDDSGQSYKPAKQRQATIDLGGRYGLNRDKSLILLLMGGRSFQKPSPTNSQPSWIAYVGLQMQFGNH